jgi:outer membrane protein
MPISLPRLRRAPFAPALLVLALGLGGAAQAQSLKELYEAARGYDATYQSARLATDAAGFRAEQSLALNRPRVDAVGTAGASDANVGQNVRAVRLSGGVEMQQSLYNRANDKTITQAQRATDVARAQLVAAEQDLIVRVSQAYFDVLAATDVLNTVRQAKRATSEQLASAKRNFEVGTATITDTREAQARFDLGTAQELAAENDLNVKRLALDSVVGRSGLMPKPLAQPVALPGLQPPAVEEWVTQADNASPVLRQLRLALEVARLETEKARDGLRPTVGWSAGFSTGHVSSRVPTAIGTVSNNDSGFDTSVGLRLTMPLYSGGSIQNRIKETLSLEQKAQSDLEAARRSLAQGTRSAFFGVQSLRAQVAALEAAESSSKLALDATQLGYKVGVRVNLDVLNAQTQLFQAQRDLAKARYDVVVNALKLRQVAGMLQPQDVDAVDALLAR